MKHLKFILPALVVALTSCGGDDASEVKEPVKLESFEDSVSYSIGTFEAKEIVESNDPNSDRYDKDMIIEGFKAGFKPGFVEDMSNPCYGSIQKLFGPQGMDFDTTYLKEGCKCIGELTGGILYRQLDQFKSVDKINKEVLYRGFEDAIYMNDTVLSKADRMAVLERFNMKIQEIMIAEQEKHLKELSAKEAPQWDKVKAIPGIKVLEGGICVETIKKGTGATPTATDDVEASYILSNFNGELIQNSADVTPDGKYQANLGSGVIQGWTIGFQGMQKGGKYKLYVPAEYAYKQESLVFEIELFDVGPAGSIYVPQAMPQQY